MQSQFIKLVEEIHARGWTPGTGGNFSYVLSRSPLRVAITPSGAEKGSIIAEHLLTVDADGNVIGEGKASAETLLHLAIIEHFDAEVVLHTHSVWNTLASFAGDCLDLSGYEMLKALGHATHATSESIPILENSQYMRELSPRIAAIAQNQPSAKGILLSGHGLYTWGNSIDDAQRHLETLEFLFEVELRRQALIRLGP